MTQNCAFSCFTLSLLLSSLFLYWFYFCGISGIYWKCRDGGNAQPRSHRLVQVHKDCEPPYVWHQVAQLVELSCYVSYLASSLWLIEQKVNNWFSLQNLCLWTSRSMDMRSTGTRSTFNFQLQQQRRQLQQLNNIKYQVSRKIDINSSI